MSGSASELRSRRGPRPPSEQPDRTILEDLRSFAREIGVHGSSALSKTELVETLRQLYQLEQIRSAGAR